jgi:anti-sigma regulatory factor (Ser/Thr protein kinase)
MSMTEASIGGQTRVTDGYLHDVMFWFGVDDFVTKTAQFVRDGLEAGEPVMVALPAERVALLRRRLGRVSEDVTFAEMESVGANPACLINAWIEFARESGGRPSRGVGEPLWPGRRSAEVTECQLHEALLNVAIGAETPLWLRCPYDAVDLPGEVLEGARHSHPWVADSSGQLRASMGYAGELAAKRTFATALPEPSVRPVQRTIAPDTLRGLRELVVYAARVSGVDEDRCSDLGLALHELSVNSIVHGGGTGLLRLWREPGDLVCEVSDGGHIGDPLAGRIPPAKDDIEGRGLWMVNQLSDLVQLRSGSAGTTVRVHTWL